MRNSNFNKNDWVSHFLPFAEGGNVEAQIAVGWAYYSGEIFPKNIERSIYWFRSAQRYGYELGAFSLIKMFKIERMEEINNVFKENDIWELGAIYLVYGDYIFLNGNEVRAKEMWRIAYKKGNLFGKIRLIQSKRKGFIWRAISSLILLPLFFRVSWISSINSKDIRVMI